jgi:hypothetical protein
VGDLDINPLETAKGNWEDGRMKTSSIAAQASQQQAPNERKPNANVLVAFSY